MGSYNTSNPNGPNKSFVDKTLVANAASGTVNLWQVAKGVKVFQLGAVLLDDTTLTNMTDCGFALYDSTATVAITKLTTLTLSTAVVGAFIAKVAGAATNAGFASAAVGGIVEAGSNPLVDYSFAVAQKNGAATFIRFNYTTTDAPINCTWRFFVEYEGIDGGSLTVV